MAGMDFGAIPTFYKGVMLRSRLEADAAFLIDLLGYTWQYEAFSFLLDDGTHYRPDFYVPEIRLWLECRGYSSEKGDRQLFEFAQMIYRGRLDPDGGTRDATILHPETKSLENEYPFIDAPDFLVLREGALQHYEYVGRNGGSVKASWPFLGQCAYCAGWVFLGALGDTACRRCFAKDGRDGIGHFSRTFNLDMDRGRILLARHYPDWSDVRAWGQRYGLPTTPNEV